MIRIHSIRCSPGKVLAGTALVLLAGCNSMSDKPADGFLVEGQLERPLAGKFVALYKVTPTDYVLVDSVEAAGGKFRFTGKVAPDKLQMFMLKVYGGQRQFFVAGNEDIEVDVKGDAPAARILISAGEEQKKLEPVLALFDRQNAEMQPMLYEYQLAASNRDLPRAERYRGMLDRASGFFKQRYHHLIDSLGPSFAAYTAATRLDMQENIGALDTLAGGLMTNYKGETWAQEFGRQVKEAKALAMGQPAPSFAQATPAGDMVGPASFKGKYVVLDFWASWCKPCRLNSPAMVRLYKKYKSRDVEILGVSLDDNKERWTQAIADDGYTWPQVSDLQQWNNAAARAYKVEGIPHLVLLDREGRIVARNLTPETLDVLLASLTGNMGVPAARM